MNDIFWDQHFGHGLDFAAIAAVALWEKKMRYAEQVTPAFSVRDSEAVLTVVWDLHFTSSTSRMLPQCLALCFFCCHTLLGAWRPWPLERILLSRHGFVGVAVLIRRAAVRSRHTCCPVETSSLNLKLYCTRLQGRLVPSSTPVENRLPMCSFATLLNDRWPFRTSCPRAAARCSQILFNSRPVRSGASNSGQFVHRT